MARSSYLKWCSWVQNSTLKSQRHPRIGGQRRVRIRPWEGSFGDLPSTLWQILVLLESVTNISSPNSFRSWDKDLGGSFSIANAKHGDNQVSSPSPKECNDSVRGADVPRTQAAVISRELLQQIKKKTNAYSASYWPSVAELVLGMTKSEASVVITRIWEDLTLPVWKGEDRETFLGWLS